MVCPVHVTRVDKLNWYNGNLLTTAVAQAQARGALNDEKVHIYVIECKSVCLLHSEAKQYQSIGIWSRERFTAGLQKELGGSCLKIPKLPQSFQQSPFLGKVREAWLVVANILVSDPLFLHSSHKVWETTKTNVVICSDKKGQRSQGWILSSKVQAYSTWDLTIVW